MIHGNYVIDSEVTFGNERQLATSSCCARVQYQVLTLLRLQYYYEPYQDHAAALKDKKIQIYCNLEPAL